MKSIVVLGWFIFLLLGGFFLAFSGSVDDAHITYWSAWILAHQGEVLNYNYERIEQSSALLQVIILAILHKLTAISVVTLGHVFTIIVSMFTIALTGRLAKTICNKMVEPVVVLLASAPFFVYWAFGGMEGPLLALLLVLHPIVWKSFLENGASVLTVIALSLATQLARPEMLLVCGFSASVLLMLRLLMPVLPLRALVILLLAQVFVAGLILSLRLMYFHDGWPQPVSVKAGGDVLAGTMMGLQYAWQAIGQPGLMLSSVLGIASLSYVVVLACKRKPGPLSLIITSIVAATYSGFVVISGGDWMAAGRFWVPVVPLYLLMMAYMLASCVHHLVVRRSIVIVLLSGHMLFLWQGASTEFNAIPLWKQNKLMPVDRAEEYSYFELHGREHLHDIPTLAFLKPLIRQIRDKQGEAKPLQIMVGQAGMVMYYMNQAFPGQLRVTDRNGLVDRTFSNCGLAKGLPRTRNGLGNGYEWIMAHKIELQEKCGFKMPDIIFDIDAAWNKKNTDALRQNGYVLVYQQRGHIINDDLLLPVRKIGAGQYVAVSSAIYRLLGSPETTHRYF